MARRRTAVHYTSLPIVFPPHEKVSVGEKEVDQVRSTFRECIEEALLPSSSKLHLLSAKREVLDVVRDCVHKRYGQPPEETLDVVWKEYMGKNARILEILEALKEQSLSIPGAGFKVRAYRKAIATIESLEVPILSGEQAQKLPGIGKKIAAKIDEVLETGELEAITRKTPEERQREQILKDFRDIWGVGPITAVTLYEKGYRDVKKIPPGALNAKQRIGLRYYDDLRKRIPRAEITRFEKKLQKVLKDIDPKLKMCICGSYRRGLKTSGDIDVLITYDGKRPKIAFKRILAVLRRKGILIADLAEGKDIYNGITQTEEFARRIDIHYVPLKEWGSATLYFTGSKQFNIDMRNLAIRQGLKLSDKGLFDRHENRLPVFTEEEILEALGLPFIAPKNRTDLSRFQ